jgi:hypothetical protein
MIFSQKIGKKSWVNGKNCMCKNVRAFKGPLGVFLVLFVHLAKDESQAIQPAKEEFSIGMLWMIQGSDL